MKQRKPRWCKVKIEKALRMQAAGFPAVPHGSDPAFMLVLATTLQLINFK